MYDSGHFVDFHLNQKQNEIMIILNRSYLQKHDGATSRAGTLVLWIVVCPFVLFLLAIVLSVLLRFRDSDYSFSIFKLFSIYIAKVIYHNLMVLSIL